MRSHFEAALNRIFGWHWKYGDVTEAQVFADPLPLRLTGGRYGCPHCGKTYAKLGNCMASHLKFRHGDWATGVAVDRGEATVGVPLPRSVADMVKATAAEAGLSVAEFLREAMDALKVEGVAPG